MLTQNAKPAEIQRSCVFAENFKSAAAINKNGGVITGALDFRDNGAYFDGSDYIKYTKPTFFSFGFYSVVIEFTPSFEADDGNEHCFYSTQANVTWLDKSGSAGSNALLLRAGGGTTPISVALATYQPYWKTNQRNCIVVNISYTGGTNSIYLNGNLLGSSATAHTPQANDFLWIGANGGGTGLFQGTIHSFKAFRHYSNTSLLTAQEALDYYTGQTFNYDKRATCILPMTAETHDATNVRTLDVSGKGNHFTFGDGATVTTYPTKLQRRGYGFDGGDYLRRPTWVQISAPYTIIALVKNGGVAYGGAGARIVSLNGDTSSKGVAIAIYNADQTYRTLHESISWGSSSSILGNDKVVHCVVLTKVGTTSNLYIDGSLTVRSTYTGSTNESAGATIGALYTGIAGFNGEIYHVSIYPFALTPLQIIDATLKLKKSLNII